MPWSRVNYSSFLYLLWYSLAVGPEKKKKKKMLTFSLFLSQYGGVDNKAYQKSPEDFDANSQQKKTDAGVSVLLGYSLSMVRTFKLGWYTCQSPAASLLDFHSIVPLA